MSGLIGSLQNSSSALRVHSKGLEVAGKNLANINNRGYSKERVEIGDRGSINAGTATESMGVEAMGLRQNRDPLLDKSVMREITSTSSLEAAKKVLESAETALGQFLDRTKDSTSIQNATGANGGGISDALTDFFNAWESFSVKPNDSGEKQLLLAKAQILADKINSTDKRLEQVQTDADAQLTTDVGVVNGLLAEIAKTNEYIAKAELVKPFSAVDLRDQRQAKLEELAQYIDVQFGPVEDPNNPGQPDPNGLGQIIVRSGTTILLDRKNVSGQTLNANGAAVGPFSYNSATQIVQHDPDGSGGAAAVNFSANGKLQAQIDAAYINTKAARSEIADLADQITNSVNNLYAGVSNANPQFFNAKAFSATLADTDTLNLQAGHGLATGDQIRLVDLKNTTGSEGSGLSEGRTYFVSSVVGDTIKLSETKNGVPVTITSALSAQSSFRRLGDSPMGTPAVTADTLKASNTLGGNRIALEIASLATKSFTANGTPPDLITGTYTSFFNKTVTTLGQKLNTTNIRLEDQKLSEEMAVSNRDQYSGVSQDEEMTDLMKFQRSFQASARHVNVIDTLLEQVVNRLGVG